MSIRSAELVGFVVGVGVEVEVGVTVDDGRMNLEGTRVAGGETNSKSNSRR